jgi:hypothetical protein
MNLSTYTNSNFGFESRFKRILGIKKVANRSIAAVQLQRSGDCKPCGLHGHKACPKGHFHCGNGLVEAMNA